MRMTLEAAYRCGKRISPLLSKELAWVVIGQAAAAVGAVVGVRWLTEKMQPAMYGEFGLALTGVALIQQSVGGPISQSVIRYFAPAKEEHLLREYFRSIFRMLRLTTWLVVAVSVTGFGLLWISHQGTWIPAAFLTTAIALLTGYNVAFEAVQNADRNRSTVAWHQGLLQWLRPSMALIFFACLGLSIESALGGFALASLVVVVSQWLVLRKRLGPLFAPAALTLSTKGDELRKQMLAYAWPFATWGLICWSQIASDRWLLAVFRDSSAVGAYTVCYQLGYYPMILISMALGSLATPILFTMAGSGADIPRLQRAVRANLAHILVIFAATLGATGGALFLGSAAFRAFTSPAYLPFVSNLPVLVLAGGLFACGQAASVVLLLEGQSGRMLGTKIGTAIAGIALNAIGIYFYGVSGAAWATLGFSVAYLVAMLSLTMHSQRLAWKGRLVLPVEDEWERANHDDKRTVLPNGLTTMQLATQQVFTGTTAMDVSPWVNDILRDPLSKSLLSVRENHLESEYGRRYPVVNGVYDLRLLSMRYGRTISNWRTCQEEYESFSERERRDRRLSHYLAELKGVAEVYEAMPIRGRCLDVGGGDGRLRAFLEPGHEYLSVDPFLEMGFVRNKPVELKSAYPFIDQPFNFICALGEYLPLASESFGTVHMRSVLDHLSNTELALREAYRVLHKGGQLIIGLYVKGGKSNTETIAQKARFFTRTVIGAGLNRYKDHHLWHPTYVELCDLTTQCGFSVQKTHWQTSEHGNVCYLSATR